MRKFLKNKKFVLFLIFLGAFITGSVLAYNTGSGLELDWPPSPGGTILTISTPLPKLVKYFYEWGIALGGLVAFIALVIAGFLYLTSMGDPNKMKEAKDRAFSAIAGLVLLLASWLILNTINPELVTLRLPSIDSGKKGQFDCDTDEDCPKDGKYKCTDPERNNGIKEGVCLKEEKAKKEATRATVECGENTRTTLSLKPGDTKECVSPANFETFATDEKGNEISCCDEKAKKEGYYGCGGHLHVFSEKRFLWWRNTCATREAIVPGCEKRIVDYADTKIECVKFVTSTWETISNF